MSEMNEYYRDRAPVYDAVYAYPERQDDLRLLESYVTEQLIDRSVLEIAAGTGYWSQFISQGASSILATDVEQAQVEQIFRRDLRCPLETRLVDAYSLAKSVDGEFSAAFAGCWWSRIPKQRISEFLDSLHRCLEPGARVVFLDNSEVQTKRLPLSFTDQWGNTYQDRPLENGRTYRVLKNFPTESELRAAISDFGQFENYISLENFWLFQYTNAK